MSTYSGGSSRPGIWDIIFGIILIVLSLFVLGNVVLASALSVVVIGWVALIGGVVGVIASFFRIGRGGFWLALISGVLTFVLGLFILRHPAVGALTLTLLAGALFISTGLFRLFAAAEIRHGRGILIVGGVLSLILGAIILFNFFEATFTLLGVLLGVSLLVDGVTLLLTGSPGPRRVGGR